MRFLVIDLGPVDDSPWPIMVYEVYSEFDASVLEATLTSRNVAVVTDEDIWHTVR